jgi:hypothetical protein
MNLLKVEGYRKEIVTAMDILSWLYIMVAAFAIGYAAFRGIYGLTGSLKMTIIAAVVFKATLLIGFLYRGHRGRIKRGLHV